MSEKKSDYQLILTSRHITAVHGREILHGGSWCIGYRALWNR